MFITIQQLVNDLPSGMERQVRFQHGGTLSQTDYEEIGHGDIRRAHSNKALAISNANIKLSLSVSGSGWQSPGLDDVNWRLPVRLGCMLPLCQQTSGGAIVPVRPVRSDVESFGFGVTSTGLVNTPLTGLEPAPVAGALYYLVYFYPALDGYGRFKGGFDQRSGEYRWSVDFQEK
ncbi:MAG: hypothetical protein LBE24_10695 [Methylobacillus sp.]|jgi:hypothetical protein|nr:hypothetical protein [Methylobacillus sp.]